jgi:outer membrane protein OmpA-like peptidoglycan-associated protein
MMIRNVVAGTLASATLIACHCPNGHVEDCPRPAMMTCPPAPAPAVSEAQESERPPPEKEQTDVPSQCQLAVSDEIKAKCEIADDDSYFAFDSAKLTPRDDRVLHQLSDCFTKGPMAGRPIHLVGHTDPRGSDAYNMVLGQRRADSVKAALVAKGMPASGIATSSRGKLDAKGYDPATWALDRRVDVL